MEVVHDEHEIFVLLLNKLSRHDTRRCAGEEQIARIDDAGIDAGRCGRNVFCALTEFLFRAMDQVFRIVKGHVCHGKARITNAATVGLSIASLKLSISRVSMFKPSRIVIT